MARFLIPSLILAVSVSSIAHASFSNSEDDKYFESPFDKGYFLYLDRKIPEAQKYFEEGIEKDNSRGCKEYYAYCILQKEEKTQEDIKKAFDYLVSSYHQGSEGAKDFFNSVSYNIIDNIEKGYISKSLEVFQEKLK